MKFSTYTWQLYKQSDQGKAAIAAFMPECEDDCYNVFIKYNPGFTGDKDTYTDLLETAYVWASDWEIDSLEDAKDAFTFIVNHGLRMEGQDVIFPQEYDFILLIISPLSFGLYNSSKLFPISFNTISTLSKSWSIISSWSCRIIPKRAIIALGACTTGSFARCFISFGWITIYPRKSFARSFMTLLPM